MTEVAVIVPTHNRPRLLAMTLRSILAQRKVDVGVTVVDDGSLEPAAVAAELHRLGDRRVTLVRHEVPRGVSAARNSGIARSSSEWIAFCDDDDLWAPEKLYGQLKAARDASAAWAYAGDVAVDAELRVLHGSPPISPDRLMTTIERHNPVPAGSSNVIVQRRVLDAVGGFDARLLSAGDWDLWIRLARHGTPAAVSLPLVAYREHGSTMRQNRRRVLSDLKVIARRYGLRADRARHFRWAAWDCLVEGRRAEALGYYARAVARGDVLSVGRAMVALAHPGVISRRRTRPAGSWASEAQHWLDELRAETISA